MPSSKIKSKNVTLTKGNTTLIKMGKWTIEQLQDGKLSFKYNGIHQCVLEPLN